MSGSWGDRAWAADDTANARGRLDDVRAAIKRDQSKKASLDSAASAKAAELDRLRTELSAAAAAMQAHEAAMSSLETDIKSLTAEKDLKIKALSARRSQLGDTLAALQRMSLRPAAVLIVSPGDPNDVVRSGLLLRTAVPQIEAQTKALKRQLAEIAALSREMAAKGAKLQTASVALAGERDKLAELTAAKKRALKQTEKERKSTERHIAALAAEAKSLEELLARLNRGRRGGASPETANRRCAPGSGRSTGEHAPATADHSGARPVDPPASGAIVKKFGAATDTGGTTRGVTWKTRAAAIVVAPWEGRVVFLPIRFAVSAVS